MTSLLDYLMDPPRPQSHQLSSVGIPPIPYDIHFTTYRIIFFVVCHHFAYALYHQLP